MNLPRTVRHRFPKRPISAIILSSNVTLTSRHFHSDYNHAIITYETEDAALDSHTKFNAPKKRVWKNKKSCQKRREGLPNAFLVGEFEKRTRAARSLSWRAVSSGAWCEGLLLSWSASGDHERICRNDHGPMI